MAYINSDLNKVIKNPFVRKSIEKSKQVIFLPAFVVTLVSFMILAGILYGIIKHPQVTMIISGAMSLFTGYYIYTYTLYSWVRKNVTENKEYEDDWISEVKRIYFSNKFIPRNTYLKKSQRLLNETEQYTQAKNSQSQKNLSSLGFGEKIIVKKSKKTSLLILVFTIIIFFLFTNEYLFPIFKDGLEIRRSGMLQRVWYPVEYFLGALVIMGVYQIFNLFRVKKILEISKSGILYQDYLYQWQDISNEEVTFGKRSRVYSRGIISHYLAFSYHNEKIFIKINSLDKSPKKIASALWFYKNQYSSF
jgi:hypothetical protein